LISGIGKKVSVKFYMEGTLVENAFNNIAITGGVGGPPSAEIRIVPTNTARNILPRTHVAVFATDPWRDDATLKPGENPHKLGCAAITTTNATGASCSRCVPRSSEPPIPLAATN
jgi:hypothetical protein